MEGVSISRIAALAADPARARTLVALMDGRALPAGELAARNGLSAATMSAHLSKMVEGRLLRVESQGRHRYYRLAGPKVATLIETLGALAPLPRVETEDRLRLSGMRFARTCYRHLAGFAAVELNLAAQRRGLWAQAANKQYRLTEDGLRWLGELGCDPGQGARKLGFARACLDWSERRHHVSGPLGALLLDCLLRLQWAARGREPRTIRLTLKGREALAKRLGLRLPRV